MLGFHCCMGISLVVASEGSSSCSAQASHCGGFSCGRAQTLIHPGFSSCGTWTQQLWCMDLAAARHVGSSQIRDQTLSPASAGTFFTTEPPGKPWAKGFHAQNFCPIHLCTSWLWELANTLILDKCNWTNPLGSSPILRSSQSTSEQRGGSDSFFSQER